MFPYLVRMHNTFSPKLQHSFGEQKPKKNKCLNNQPTCGELFFIQTWRSLYSKDQFDPLEGGTLIRANLH